MAQVETVPDDIEAPAVIGRASSKSEACDCIVCLPFVISEKDSRGDGNVAEPDEIELDFVAFEGNGGAGGSDDGRGPQRPEDEGGGLIGLAAT